MGTYSPDRAVSTNLNQCTSMDKTLAFYLFEIAGLNTDVYLFRFADALLNKAGLAACVGWTWASIATAVSGIATKDYIMQSSIVSCLWLARLASKGRASDHCRNMTPSAERAFPKSSILCFFSAVHGMSEAIVW